MSRSLRWLVWIVGLGLVQVWLTAILLQIIGQGFDPSTLLPNSVLLFFSTAIVGSSMYALSSVDMLRGRYRTFGVVIIAGLLYSAMIFYGRDIVCFFFASVSAYEQGPRLLTECLLTAIALLYAFQVDRYVGSVFFRPPV